jgi:5'-nucleotidase
VAFAEQQSGSGGTFTLPTTNILAPGGEFGSIPVGAPFFGHDEMDANICNESISSQRRISSDILIIPGYFNGTPAATALFGIDVLGPKHFGTKDVGLVVAGPNESQNNGPFFYTISGTVGATYASIERSYPAIAVNAGNSTHRSFTTNTGEASDPANLAAKVYIIRPLFRSADLLNILMKVTVDFIRALALGHKRGERLLPLGVGLK